MISETKYEIAKRMHNDKIHMKKIAEYLDISLSSLYEMKKNNFIFQPFNSERAKRKNERQLLILKKLEEETNQQKLQMEIAQELGVSYSTISLDYKKLGIRKKK